MPAFEDRFNTVVSVGACLLDLDSKKVCDKIKALSFS